MKNNISRTILSASIGIALSSPVLATSTEQLENRISDLENRLEATASMMDSQEMTGHGSHDKTTIGGYGEMHYNNLDSKQEMDFHRAVLFVGHEFDDNIRFFTEWDLEHAFTLELEQAYLEFDLNDNQRISAGVMLMPVGITNETHEPPTFYGVERNPVENKIIPTTWREGGVGLSGNMANGLSYDLLLTTGLNDATYIIRDGRQHVAKAVAEDLATTMRLKWTGMPGVELSASYHLQSNVTQSLDADASAALLETHAVVNRGPLTVKALYASWNIDGAGAKTTGKNEQNGWYLEPSYKLTSQTGIFARYNAWDNSAGSTTDTEETQTELGANFWPHENVVIKTDFMQKNKAGSKTDEGFNLGVGYHF